jgi:hypothetical protein
MPFQADGPAAATRARAALSDISNSKNSARAPNGAKVRACHSLRARRSCTTEPACPPAHGQLPAGIAPALS